MQYLCKAKCVDVVSCFESAEKIERTVQIEASTVEIEERGVKLRLTVVDTPGYGDAINSQDWCVDAMWWRHNLSIILSFPLRLYLKSQFSVGTKSKRQVTVADITL